MSTAEKASVRTERENALTEQVVRSFDGSTDERFRTVMQSLTRHLHAFIRDVELTSEEWNRAIEFLTQVGHITDDKRQEFILLSDVLGASMLTVSVNSPNEPEATESTVFGPFFVEGSPRVEPGGDIAGNASGEAAYVCGRVLDIDGNPVAGARIEVWEADDDGFYDVQYTDDRVAGRAHLYSRDDGSYDFWCVRPAAYPIPHDGPVGRMLSYAGRSPMRPAHLHYMVSAPGYSTLITHIFVDGCEYIDNDTVFGVKPSLIVTFEPHEDGTAPDGRAMTGPWHSATFDIVLAADA